MYYNTKGQENPTENFHWQFILIDDDQTKNAWCMPGGKIAFILVFFPFVKMKTGLHHDGT